MQKLINRKYIEVLELIEKVITGNLKISELAEKINMSEKLLEQWVRKEFNLTPKELIARMKLPTNDIVID